MSCKSCGWPTFTKQIVCKAYMVETVKSWQLMTRELAQAGNRAGKTERYLQWLESKPE